MENLYRDFRHSLRSLARTPGFTAVVALTLALGIGANTAIFSVVRGVLLRPLPFGDPDRLVRLNEIAPEGWKVGFSPPNLISLREQSVTLEAVTAYTNTSLTLTGDGDPERLHVMSVTPGFFGLLGFPLDRGRSFLEEEAVAGAAPVVVLAHGTWQRRFGGDPDILGKMITLSGAQRTVVGVASPAFRLGEESPAAWIPSEFSPRDLDLRGRHFLRVLGRLKPGVDVEAAARELETIWSRLAEAYPDTNRGWSITADPLRRAVVGEARTPLLVLLGAVGFVLLIACANVTSLILARSEQRGREFAIRSALGATRGRLVGQLLTESMLLAILGGGVGLWLANIGMDALLVGIGAQIPRAGEVGIDWLVLTFTTIITLLAGILVGLIPAAQGTRIDPQSALKEGGLLGLSRLGRHRLRRVLVVGEVALSLMLVIGAGLLLNSLWRLVHVDAGFNKEQLLTGRVSLPSSRYETPAQRVAFFDAVLEEIERLPGVESAAAVESLPMTGWHATRIPLPGRPDEDPQRVERRNVTPGYFRTMGIHLVAGRPVEEFDRTGSPHVIVVNETFGRRFFPGGEVLGRRIAWDGPTRMEDLEIVGVVGDTRMLGLSQEAVPTMYIPNAQIQPPESMAIVIRTGGDPVSLAPAMRQAIWSLDPDLTVYEVATMEHVVEGTFDRERLWLLLLGIFAALALLLTAVGIYGVLSYLVSQRTHELGVRIAIGGGRRAVLGLIVRQGMGLVLIGVALGVAGALALGRVLGGLLHGVSPADPATFAAVLLFFLVVALAACYLPARRAAGVDPIQALRCE